MKATAIAHANIALIKYWGKKDPKLNLPENSSLAVNLSNLTSTTTVAFSDDFDEDSFSINATRENIEIERLIAHINLIRDLASTKQKVKVVSENNFPTATGLASSASGFAALTLAAIAALGLKLSEKELSLLARRGAGSACRSIPDGFTEWVAGTSDKTSYAQTVFDANHWNIAILAVIVNQEKKVVSNTVGHTLAQTSPFYQTRLLRVPKKIKAMKQAIEDKNFALFGKILEADAIELHVITLTSDPAIIYWDPATIRIMKLCQTLRQQGLPVYFTFDAGPQPVLFCLQKDAKKLETIIRSTKGVLDIIVNKPAEGARLIDKHLF